MNYFGEQEMPTFDKSKWHYGKYAEKKPLAIQIDLSKATVYGEPMKLTPDDLLREALKDDPIAEMVELITQRHEIQQSINTLLPKMTRNEVREVYHTLCRIEQKVNEREEQ